MTLFRSGKMSTAIRFGVGFEMVVRAKQTTVIELERYFDNAPLETLLDEEFKHRFCRSVIHRYIRDQFQSSAIRVYDLENDDDDDEEPYSKWTITPDGSIDDTGDGYAVEIVSPILHMEQDWESEIEDMWHVLTANFDVVTQVRHQCGTPTSNHPTPWTSLVRCMRAPDSGDG